MQLSLVSMRSLRLQQMFFFNATRDGGKMTTKNIGKREHLVPASVRIAKEKAAAKLQAARARIAAKARLKAAKREHEITKMVLRIVRALDRKAAQREREAEKLEKKAERIAFLLTRRDRIDEQRLLRRAQREMGKQKHKQAARARR